MSQEYALFLGCLVPTRAPGIESSMRKIAEKLDITFHDKDFLCCPSQAGVRILDQDTWLAIAARNIAMAEQDGLDIVSPCSGCSNSLIEADHILKHDEAKKAKINEILAGIGKEYKGTVKIKHFMNVLYEDVGVEKIKSAVTKPLDLKVACHYGCHLLRPSDVVQFDDPEHPRSMDDIVEAIGGEAVDYRQKDLCCGSVLLRMEEIASLHMVREKLGYIQDVGGEVLATSCPACFGQFDRGQVKLMRGLEDGTEAVRFDIPILDISQLIGISMGLGAKDLGLFTHKTSPKAVMKKLDIGK